jgi:hypothetical protein
MVPWIHYVDVVEVHLGQSGVSIVSLGSWYIGILLVYGVLSVWLMLIVAILFTGRSEGS